MLGKISVFFVPWVRQDKTSLAATDSSWCLGVSLAWHIAELHFWWVTIRILQKLVLNWQHQWRKQESCDMEPDQRRLSRWCCLLIKKVVCKLNTVGNIWKILKIVVYGVSPNNAWGIWSIQVDNWICFSEVMKVPVILSNGYVPLVCESFSLLLLSVILHAYTIRKYHTTNRLIVFSRIHKS